MLLFLGVLKAKFCSTRFTGVHAYPCLTLKRAGTGLHWNLLWSVICEHSPTAQHEYRRPKTPKGGRDPQGL